MLSLASHVYYLFLCPNGDREIVLETGFSISLYHTRCSFKWLLVLQKMHRVQLDGLEWLLRNHLGMMVIHQHWRQKAFVHTWMKTKSIGWSYKLFMVIFYNLSILQVHDNKIHTLFMEMHAFASFIDINIGFFYWSFVWMFEPICYAIDARIDHRVGKDLIENLTVLRFSNLVFEPLWCRTYIKNVQVRNKIPSTIKICSWFQMAVINSTNFCWKI